MANAVLEYVCLVHYKTIMITKSGGDISLSDSDIILGQLLEPFDICFISFLVYSRVEILLALLIIW